MERLSKTEIDALLDSIQLGTPVLIRFDDAEWQGIFEGLDLNGSILMRDLQALDTIQEVTLPGLTRILVDRVQYMEKKSENGESEDSEHS